MQHLSDAYARSKEIEQQHPALKKVIQEDKHGVTALNSQIYESFKECYEHYKHLGLYDEKSSGRTYELGPPQQPKPNQF